MNDNELISSTCIYIYVRIYGMKKNFTYKTSFSSDKVSCYTILAYCKLQRDCMETRADSNFSLDCL